ncbi:MAG: hypothetical protein ACLTCP_05665 [Ruminococcus bicirculans (ex Wegman et al. 2014)]
MKSITFPAFAASSIQLFNRSSKSPRYFAPCRGSYIKEKIRFEDNADGTSPSIIFLASPSTTAVFPHLPHLQGRIVLCAAAEYLHDTFCFSFSAYAGVKFFALAFA